MKAYRVVFHAGAHEEALAAVEYIARTAPLNAARWYAGFEKAVGSLRLFPHRCPMAPESNYLEQELRHYVFKSHRIIFRIEEESRIVRVFHVRHSARRRIGEREPFDPE